MFKFFKRKSRKPDPGQAAFNGDGAASRRQEEETEVKNYSVITALQTDPGCVREINEDCGRYVDPGDDSLMRTRGRIAIVADGMGGHSAGEVASGIAVEVISRAYYEGNDDAFSALRRSFLEANSTIHESSLKEEGLNGMGTTCTALVLKNGSAIAAHVGDSRLYLIRNEQIYLMTEDHSAVMEMVKRGLMSLEEARHHPDKNVILRALGSHPTVEVTIWDEPFPIKEGDKFLLCSDGLYDLVEDDEIRQAVLSADVHEACSSLITLAKNRGGYDNITIAILGVDASPENPAPIAKETRQVEVIQ